MAKIKPSESLQRAIQSIQDFSEIFSDGHCLVEASVDADRSWLLKCVSLDTLDKDSSRSGRCPWKRDLGMFA